MLSPEERRRFRDFVASPYFNRRAETSRLLEALLPFHKEAPGKAFLFELVFPGTPYNDHRLRQTMSFLFKLLLEFLAYEAFKADEVEKGRSLGIALHKRQVADLGERVLANAQKRLHALPVRNADYHERAYQLGLASNRLAFDRVEPGTVAIQEISDQLDTAFLARKLWQACFLWSHQSVSNTAYHYGLLPQIMAYLEKTGIPDDPAIFTYYHCFKALSEPEEARHFERFLKIILENSAVFPDEELRDLFVLALNFCIRQNNAGNHAYHQAQFELYQKGMTKGYFISDGYLPRTTYLNAVTSALVVGAYHWAEQFTDDYRGQLQVGYRQALWRFNHARLAHARRNSGHALELLRGVDVRDLMLQLAVRTLQIKIFHELGAFDLLESHLQALHTFIRRKKNLGYHRNNYLNLIRLLRQRLELPPLDRSAKKSWLAQVEATGELAEREWLLAQT